MSLRKSPTLTPALLASDCGITKKSTGPRTARGMAPGRLHGRKEGAYSPTPGELPGELFKRPRRCGVRNGSGQFDSGGSGSSLFCTVFGSHPLGCNRLVWR